MSKAVRPLVGAFSAALFIACATPRSATEGARPGGSPASEVVNAPELIQAGQGRSLLAALEQTRPGFLMRRGKAPMVSIDGGPVTDQSSLRLIPVTHVYEVRLIRATSGRNPSAQMPNGDVVVGDVILVLTRKG